MPQGAQRRQAGWIGAAADVLTGDPIAYRDLREERGVELLSGEDVCDCPDEDVHLEVALGVGLPGRTLAEPTADLEEIAY